MPFSQVNRRASPRQRPGEPTRRSSGVATITPSAATQRNPKNAEGQGLSRSRQAKTRERRPNVPTASISAFLGTSAGIPHGTERTAGNRHQGNVRNNARGTRRRRQFRPRQRNPVAAAVRHRLQSPGTARQTLETSPTSGTDSPPATVKGTPPPRAALPPCRRPQRRSGTPKRRRTRPQRIKAGRDKGTTAERAHRLDFGLFRYVRRDYPRDGMRPEAGGTKATSGTTPGEPAADGNFDPGSGTR